MLGNLGDLFENLVHQCRRIMVCRFLHISQAVINIQWQKEAHILENNICLLLKVLLHGTPHQSIH